jgi:hypothetical protein
MQMILARRRNHFGRFLGRCRRRADQCTRSSKQRGEAAPDDWQFDSQIQHFRGPSNYKRRSEAACPEYSSSLQHRPATSPDRIKNRCPQRAWGSNPLSAPPQTFEAYLTQWLEATTGELSASDLRVIRAQCPRARARPSAASDYSPDAGGRSGDGRAAAMARPLAALSRAGDAAAVSRVVAEDKRIALIRTIHEVARDF